MTVMGRLRSLDDRLPTGISVSVARRISRVGLWAQAVFAVAVVVAAVVTSNAAVLVFLAFPLLGVILATVGRVCADILEQQLARIHPGESDS